MDVRLLKPTSTVRTPFYEWDGDTKTVSYLFTEDHHFVTDSELGIGGPCN